LGRVRDDDAEARRRVDVDVVDADTGAADHLEPRRARLDQVGGQLRRRADDDRVEAAERRREGGLRVDVDVEPLAEERDARVRDRLPHEDARAAHTREASYASSARATATPASARPVSIAASAVTMSKTSK